MNTQLNLDTNVVSISSASMMVELSISTWSGNKLDKQASTAVTSANGAESTVARVNKSLLATCSELKEIKTLVGEARNHIHYGLTMPWSDSGLRLLPTTLYFDYVQKMSEVENKFYSLVDDFINNYDYEIVKAQARMGSLFNQEDYPSAESLRGKFMFSINYIPLPTGGDFRLDIGNEAIADLQRDYETAFTDKLETAMADIWSRLYKALASMSERLDYADHDKKKVFRDSLVENVGEMIDMLKACNVTGNSQMSAMADKLDYAMRGITPEALREDSYLRDKTKKAVDDAIKQLPNLSNKPSALATLAKNTETPYFDCAVQESGDVNLPSLGW